MRNSLLIGLFVLAAGCGDSGDNAEVDAGTHEGSMAAPIEVGVDTVGARVFADTIEATGALEPSRSVQVAANTAGRVLQVFADRGDHITEGDVIAVVDNRSVRQNREAVRLQRELAEAQAAQARRDCERAVQLLDEGVIAPADAQALETRCAAAEIQVDAASAQLGVVDVALSDSSVRAPFSGVVSNAMTEVGAYVQPPSPVLELHQIDPLTLVVALPAMYVGAIDVGQRVLVDFPDLTGVETREAVVSRVAPSLSPMTRSLPVEVSVPNTDSSLRGGLFARARFVSGSREVAAVPEAAVVDRDGRLRAYVVRDGVAFEELIDRQTPFEGFYRAPDSIAVGDTLVVRPGPELRDGSRVITVSSGSGAE